MFVPAHFGASICHDDFPAAVAMDHEIGYRTKFAVSPGGNDHNG